MEFAQIFTQMHWVPAMLLILGVVLFVVEIFVPGFGFFGISGFGCLIAGIIVRICQGLNLTQSLALVLIVLGFLTLVVMIMVWGAQYGLLGKTGLFERRTTLSADYNKVSRELKKLVGKNGKTVSKLDLGGQAKIKGRVYDVVSMSSYIEANTRIKVEKIEDNTIIVRKWFE